MRKFCAHNLAPPDLQSGGKRHGICNSDFPLLLRGFSVFNLEFKKVKLKCKKVM